MVINVVRIFITRLHVLGETSCSAMRRLPTVEYSLILLHNGILQLSLCDLHLVGLCDWKDRRIPKVLLYLLQHVVVRVYVVKTLISGPSRQGRSATGETE